MSPISSLIKVIKNLYFLLKAFSNIKQRNKIEKVVQENLKINILANGPSLASALNKYPDFIFHGGSYICVNDFATTEFYDNIKPRYYVIFDPNHWLENVSENLRSRRERLFESLFKKTKWPITLFIPVDASKSNEIRNLTNNSNISISFINTKDYPVAHRIKFFLYKNNLALPHVQNVLVACIFISINLGYKEIFLYGADHSWTETLCVDENNVVCLRDKHFYDEKTTIMEPWFKDATTTFRIDEILYLLSLKFQGYRLLAKYANYMNARIYNTSKNSFIDAFEKI